MLESLLAARQELNKAREVFRDTVIQTQLSCDHRKIYECDYLPGREFGQGLPPIRVCDSCGLSEEGWGCGYLILTGEIVPIDREALYQKRLGRTILREDKGLFIHNDKRHALGYFLGENRSSI